MKRAGRLTITAFAATVLAAAGAFTATTAAAEDMEAEAEMEDVEVDPDAIFLPLLVYRTGPYAPNGSAFFNGVSDYLEMIQTRDGGVNGVPLQWAECETRYDASMGVECYERMKNRGSKGAAVMNPLSTGITYAIMDLARDDEIPVHSIAHGRAAATYGKVFEWTFTLPTTYWAQASAIVRYIAEGEGGMDQLEGKKIGLIYHNSAYGREPIPTLEQLQELHGYELSTYPVDHPGQEQSGAWLQIRRDRLDYLILWGWGVMNQVSLREAARINFPMDRLIGVWWSGSETDVRPVGADAAGYTAANFHGVGPDFGVLQDILEHVYNADEGAARENNWGEVLYNRGVVSYIYVIEAIRTAMAEYGNQTLSGEEVRWGLENLDLTAERISEMGAEGLLEPIKITCEDHEGQGPVVFQQWSGERWERVSDWIDPIQEVVWPMYEDAALAYAEEHDLPIRDC